MKKRSDPHSSEITSESVYFGRRAFIKNAGIATVGTGLGLFSHFASADTEFKLSGFSKTRWGADEKLTPYEDVTSYNNFYEFEPVS